MRCKLHDVEDGTECLRAHKGSRASSCSPYSELGPTEIRVVDILPGSFDDLQDNPIYEALSYVSNPRDRSVQLDKVLQPAVLKNFENHPVEIGVNLDAAIRHNIDKAVLMVSVSLLCTFNELQCFGN
jgi:hypothetical protein